MKKPVLPSALPVAVAPTAFVPAASAAGRPQPTRPVTPQGGPATEYVDPYLFESGFFASRAEYGEIMQTTTIQTRAEAESRLRRSKPRARKPA